MMNLLRRLVNVFHIDSIAMNVLTGKACTKCFGRFSRLFPVRETISIEIHRIANPDDVQSGNTIAAQPLAPLSRICNSARNIGAAPRPEKALKERPQQHRATPTTPCVGNAPLAVKPQRGGIRRILFDFALSGLSGLGICGMLPFRRALPCANDYALSGLGDIARPRFVGRCPTLMITPLQGLAFAGHSFRKALPGRDCFRDAMHRVYAACTAYTTGVARALPSRECCFRDAMHRVSTACTPYITGVARALSGLDCCIDAIHRVYTAYKFNLSFFYTQKQFIL
jgi:hypothetical protein